MSLSHKPQLFPETASDLHALTHNQTNLLLQNSSLKPDDKWQPAKKTFINVFMHEIIRIFKACPCARDM